LYAYYYVLFAMGKLEPLPADCQFLVPKLYAGAVLSTAAAPFLRPGEAIVPICVLHDIFLVLIIVLFTQCRKDGALSGGSLAVTWSHVRRPLSTSRTC
jgi:hypothetical protein